MAIDLEGLITIREAARECHRSPETVRRWVWGGKLHAEKVGNHLFVSRSDLGLVCQRTEADRRAARLAALDELDELRERIRRYAGTFNVVEDLERSRESHPYVSSNDDER
ncbi:MAG: helix-turn-helix domain-containing protein [Dehalococcoidia bacterium]|nr:helix-turn-helix domain-containing protein [Dehalococcoidia bacterium]